MTRSRRWGLVFVALVGLSNLYRGCAGADRPAAADQSVTELPLVAGERLGAGTLRLAWRERPADRPDAPTLLLVHGSPGSGADLRGMAEAFPAHLRVLTPDLPGFGASTMAIPDYSSRAHARYLEGWLDQLGVARAHFAVHSLGGAVAIELAQRAPDRVASITLMGAVGVQELEMLGRADANHALHLLQLTWLRAFTWGTPHFGLLDRFPINVNYARNFADTDQSGLRGALERYQGPLLVLHGRHDMQVPVAAALEHHRIVPQSELHVYEDQSHFFVFLEPEETSARVARFVDAVEAGTARTRATADPARVAAAAAPFDPASAGPAEGLAATVLGLGLAAGTLVSEDLACITAGVLVAQGRLHWSVATGSVLLGIFFGDLGLMLLGRWLGRAALTRPPLSWWVAPEAVDRASAWYRRNGAAVLLSSRFMPGMRLPMYVAAGLLRTPFWNFAGWLALAAVLWTPPFIFGVALLGEAALAAIEASRVALLGFVLALAGAVLGLRQLVPLFTWRGRRLALSRWRRLTRWEFWPVWAVYPPVFLAALGFAWRHRLPTAFTAANPGMPAGGLVGESKWEIYRRLGLGDPARPADPFLPRTALLPATNPDREGAVARFRAEHGLDWPLVLKPDVGQRGDGVAVVRSDEEVRAYLARATGDVLVQQWVPGEELGVFYVRRPGAETGELFGITHKVPLDVYGDGRDTLETLILRHDRAVCLAPYHLQAHHHRLGEVPRQGERVRLQELGTHSRGSVFLDEPELGTPALLAAVDRIARDFEGGFWFGRLDLRAPTLEHLRRGEGFYVIEMNGVGSEATHVYDPRTPLTRGWRVLTEQWRLAFEVGAANARAGAPLTPLPALVRAWWTYRRRTRATHAR